MQDGVIPLFSHDRRRDSERRGGWSNQDLAELYRIEAALVQAGISIDTEMGETDEGDPWFAFCRADTCDVLVHVAIIDGEYNIAGTTASVIVKGYSFTDIVRQFMTREPAFMLGAARHNNVMIHPSSVLIAVFAAICLISDEHNTSFFGFGENEKATTNENRPDAEIFNVADQRQVVLGDFTFSPQQVFIILSAIAFSSSPIVQNSSVGLETAFGVFDLIETGDSEAEKSVELAAAETQEESYLPADEENTASKEYAQILSDRQLERIEAKASDAKDALLLKSTDEAVVVTDEAGYVEPETRDTAYVEGATDSAPVEETQTVAAEPEPIVQKPVAESNDVAVAPVASDNWVVDFFTSNAEFADAGEEISILIDSLEADLSAFVSNPLETVSVSAEPDMPVLNGSLGDGATLKFPTPIVVPPVEIPDYGIDVGNASTGELSELAYLFNTFEETYGDALIDDRYDRYVVHNNAANGVAYDDNAPEMAILRYELEDGTPVYFMGLPSDFEYQIV